MDNTICRLVDALWERNVLHHMPIYSWTTSNVRIYTLLQRANTRRTLGTEEELLESFEDINSLHRTIKFDYKYSKKSIDFLDTTVYLNKEGKLSTKLYVKPTDRPAYLHYQSYHPKSQKDNIPYGQALRMKRICSDEKDFQTGLKSLKSKLIVRGFKESQIDEAFQKTTKKTREQLLTTHSARSNTERKLIFATTYNRNLPNIKSLIEKNWNLLHIDQDISKRFVEEPLVAYKRNRTLRNIIGKTQIMYNKRLTPRVLTRGKCYKCLSRLGNLCCKQTDSADEFSSATTTKTYKIFHNMNCQSKGIIYLGCCTLCSNSQYVGKSETKWNIRLNNHRKDSSKVETIPFDKHFQLPNHNFTEHARFILIEQVANHGITQTMLRQRLERREDFWISKLKTMIPYGLNHQLNL